MSITEREKKIKYSQGKETTWLTEEQRLKEGFPFPETPSGIGNIQMKEKRVSTL